MADWSETLQDLEASDPDAASELVRLALYETLLDYVDADRENLQEQVNSEVSQLNGEMRRELVRKFIDARLHEVDVTPLLQAAGHLTMVDYEIAKADHDVSHEARDQTGRWTKNNHPALKTLDIVDRLTKPNAPSPVAGSGNRLASQNRYGTLAMLGQGLASSGHPGVSAAGIAMQVTGQIGPEAEAVFGDWLKKLTYRYRGTERSGDPKLTDEMENSDRLVAGLTSPDPRRKKAAQTWAAGFHDSGSLQGPNYRDKTDRPLKGISPPNIAIAEYNAGNQRGLSREQTLLDNRADIATNYLLPHISTPQHAQLSMQAGKVPPSQGVLIDDDGQVISQAMGFNGDHYLPFDLKNLKQLQGGQYVRTRVYGGPTSEDIYTGLMTGARQMTVASNTGVFTVEFDPDLRGGRRYNDKARAMVTRYQAILEAINSNKAEVGELDPNDVQDLRAHALRYGKTPEERATLFNDGMKDLKSKLAFQHEDTDFSQEAMARAKADQGHNMGIGVLSGRDKASVLANAKQYEGEMKAQAFDRSYRVQRLDAEGYSNALKALKEEFPYFIRRVSFTPLDKWQTDRGLLNEQTRSPVRSGIRAKDSAFVSSANLSFKNPKRARQAIPETAEGTPASSQGSGAPTEGSPEKKESLAPSNKTSSWGTDNVLGDGERRDLDLLIKNIGNDPVYAKIDTESREQQIKAANHPLKDIIGLQELTHWMRFHQGQFLKDFGNLDAEDQDRLLGVITGKTEDYSNVTTLGKEDQSEHVAEQMSSLKTKLDRAFPFGQDASTASVRDQIEPYTRPLKFSEIYNIGPDPDGLDLWLKTADPDLREEAEHMRSMPEDERRESMADEVNYIRSESEPTDDQLKKLADLHAAWAWSRARELAEQIPKAQAPAVGQPLTLGFRGSLTQPMVKRDLVPWDRLAAALALLDG